jgi:hypothetical protein
VKAITVRQPWAWAIIYGAKDVENRAQTWSYRGPLAIHAGTTWSPQGEVDDRVWNALCRTWHADAWRCENVHDAPSARPDRFPFGVIIGVADLTDVHRAGEGCCDSPWADAEYHGKPSTHLVLADRNPSPRRSRPAVLSGCGCPRSTSSAPSASSSPARGCRCDHPPGRPVLAPRSR